MLGCNKQRGFVNGAYCEVDEPLRRKAVFIARLLATGNMVLIHPMEEDGAMFLPCRYGYATANRRKINSVILWHRRSAFLANSLNISPLVTICTRILGQAARQKQ